jgi:hypothetical protein
LGASAAGVAVLVLSGGCAQNQVGQSTRISDKTWRADLDEYREIQLSCDRIRETIPDEPERRYERLTLEVVPREHLRLNRALKQVEVGRGVPRGQIRYEQVEARTDEARRKVWFVDREAGRVIATLDLETRQTTGPDDDPPAWATPDGGVVLELQSK